MTTFGRPTILGNTGLSVGRLGVSSSFGAPAAAFEEAFERGCNYFNWGTFIKGRSSKMRRAIHNIVASGRREQLVLALLSYSHSAWLAERFLHSALRALGTDHVDVLLLGYYSRRPPQRVLDGAQRLKASGLVRFTGITSHNRKLFAELQREGLIDVFHVRYNAAHRGAEGEVFPALAGAQRRAGVVTFTATCWGRLLQHKRMPPGEQAPSAADCYRFALSHPTVDVCMVGAKTHEQLREDLAVLDSAPMTDEELQRMRRIGDHVYGRK